MAFDGSELYYRYLKLQILFVPWHQIFLKTLQRERNSFVNKVLYNVCTLTYILWALMVYSVFLYLKISPMVGVNIFILTQINTNLHGKVLCLTSLAPFGPLLYEMRIEIWNIHGQHQIQTLHITLSYKALYMEQELLMVDPSGVREFMTGFYWGSCYSIFCFLYIMLCRLLFVLGSLTIVCPSIYRFWLPFWYLQTFLSLGVSVVTIQYQLSHYY